MTTPLSSSAPYARFADLKKYRHWPQVADWVAGCVGTSQARIAEADLADVTKDAGILVNEHLLGASGLVEAACFRGGHYSVFNLMDWPNMSTAEQNSFTTTLGRSVTAADTAQALQGASRSLLKRIVCALTIGTLSRFKTRTEGDKMDEAFGYEMLDALSSGKRIFSLLEAEDAGLPLMVEMAPAGSTQEDDRVSVMAGRLFGDRRATR